MAKVSLDTFCLEMLSLGCTLVYGRQQSAFRAAKQTLGKGSSVAFQSGGYRDSSFLCFCLLSLSLTKERLTGKGEH